MLNKYVNICKIDNVKIECLDGRCVSKLRRYVEKTHKINFEEYVLNYYYDGKKPKCLCGCGTFTKFTKGKYQKYYKDHYNTIKHPEIRCENVNIKHNELNKRLERLCMSIDDLKNIYQDFISFKINFTDINKKYLIDKRTLKKYWYELNLIENKEVFNRIIKKHQTLWTNKNGRHGAKQNINDEVIFNIYQYIKKLKNKVTIKQVRDKFNIEMSSLVIYKRLCENFGKKHIDQLIKCGISSKPEIEFFYILDYYFGEDIKKNFYIGRKQYDYILCDKILIEFDGDYWHSLLKNIENDKEKDRIAMENGYIIYRVKESECKDIAHINNLFNFYKKYKK